MNAFKALGLVVGAYTIYAVFRGKVYAKSGVWGKVVSRDDSPASFWAIIAIYAGLGIALATVF